MDLRVEIRAYSGSFCVTGFPRSDTSKSSACFQKRLLEESVPVVPESIVRLSHDLKSDRPSDSTSAVLNQIQHSSLLQ